MTTKDTKYSDNLESYSLLWLDTDVNTTEENKHTQNRLRSIINQLIPFNDVEKCKKHILSQPHDSRIILVASGRLGQAIVPQIHHLQQLSSVYIFCRDKKTHKEWSKNFSKV